MKIAIFTDAFLPNIDGVVTSTISLSKGLADKGHEVHIIAPKFKNNFKEFNYPNIHIKRVFSIEASFYPGYKFTLPLNIEILLYLIKNKIEIIHFTTPIGLGAQAILIANTLGLPLVGTFHTFVSDPQYFKHMKKSNPLMLGMVTILLSYNQPKLLKNLKIDDSIIQKATWNYLKAYYNRCDLVTCPSEYTKKELSKNRIKKKIKVISNGIYLNQFDNSNADNVRKKYGEDGPILLFVGRVAYEKNIFYLLDCFKLILEKIPKAKLIIIGDGPEMAEVKKKINSEKINKNIILTGKIEHSKLVNSSIFGACDVFVTTSLTETQGITILEAQANGLVCVGVDATSVPGLIHNNYNGYIVKVGNKKAFADAVIKILSNKKLYEKMQRNTLKEIRKHDMARVVETWEKTYMHLIKKHYGFFGLRRWIFRRNKYY